MEKEKKLARERASILLQVRSGALTATEGAERLGVSRKTYYQWEDRALKAMALALENHSPGRPSVPLDPEKEELQRKVLDLEKKLYLTEKTIEVKDLLSAFDLHEAKKTGGESRRSGRGRKESSGGCGRDAGEDRDVLSRSL
jgi:transposase